MHPNGMGSPKAGHLRGELRAFAFLVLLGALVLGGCIALLVPDIEHRSEALAKDGSGPLSGSLPFIPGGAEFRRIAERDSDGLPLFETRVGEGSIEVRIDGTPWRTSVPVDPRAVPSGVTAAVRTAYPGRSPSDYERLSLLAYRLDAGASGGPARLVDPTGRTLAHGSTELARLEVVAAPRIDDPPRAVRNEAARARSTLEAVFLEAYRVRWAGKMPPRTFLSSGEPLGRTPLPSIR